MKNFKSKYQPSFKSAALAGISAVSGIAAPPLPAAAGARLTPETSIPSTSTASFSTITSGSTQFDIAPAGTLAKMNQIVAFYQLLSGGAVLSPSVTTHVAGPGSSQEDQSGSAWLQEASDAVQDLAAEAIADGLPSPSDKTISKSIDILKICSELGAPDPSVEHDDRGGIEIFFKQGKKALLVAMQSDGSMTLFGDEPDDHWRGKYKLDGSVWKRHLVQSIDLLITA